MCRNKEPVTGTWRMPLALTLQSKNIRAAERLPGKILKRELNTEKKLLHAKIPTKQILTKQAVRQAFCSLQTITSIKAVIFPNTEQGRKADGEADAFDTSKGTSRQKDFCLLK